MTTPNQASYTSVLQNSTGQIIPGATVIVLSGTVSGSEAVNTSTMPGTPLATIYSDPYGASPINQSTSPLVTDDLGNFSFWAAPGYYVLQIYGKGVPGQIVNKRFVPGQIIQGISIGAGGTGSFTNLTVSGTATFSGTVSAKDFEGVQYADQFSGSDIGAKINAAMAALGSGGGTVYIPAGTYNFSTTIDMITNCQLIGAGSSATLLYYSGTSDAIKLSGTTSNWGTQPPYMNGLLKGFTITGYGNTNANITGIHHIDCIGTTYDDLVVSWFNSSNAVGMWFDNQVLFSERVTIRKVSVYENLKGWFFTNSNSSTPANSSSFGYWRTSEVHFQVGTSQYGIYISGDCALYNGEWNFDANASSTTPTTIIALVPYGGYAPYMTGSFDINAEDTGVSGACSYYIGAGCTMQGAGQATWNDLVPSVQTGGTYEIPWVPQMSVTSYTNTGITLTGGSGSQDILIEPGDDSSSKCALQVTNHAITSTVAAIHHDGSSQFTNTVVVEDGNGSASIGYLASGYDAVTLAGNEVLVSGNSDKNTYVKGVADVFLQSNTSGTTQSAYLDTSGIFHIPTGIVLAGSTPTVSTGQVGFGNSTATTATAGSATLPSAPLGFLEVNISGTMVKIPYYAV